MWELRYLVKQIPQKCCECFKKHLLKESQFCCDWLMHFVSNTKQKQLELITKYSALKYTVEASTCPVGVELFM